MIDSHAHLNDRAYSSAEELISRAKLAGVNKIITVGWNEESSRVCCNIASSFKDVFFTAGIHPSDCESVDNGAIEALLPLYSHEKCLAVGEIGLDYHYGKDNKEKQREAFARQLQTAKAVNLPVVIHSREATQDMLAILKENKDCLKNGFLMHCYSESAESAQEYLKLGAYFAFGGAITFKNAKKEDIIKSIPKSRVLCETDCPYMAPVPYRGKVNEPAYIKEVYAKMASVYEVSEEEFKLVVQNNAVRFFGESALGER